jgi:hypothetical protein
MSGSSPRSHPSGYPRAGLSASSVRVVIQSDDWSRKFSGQSLATPRSPSGIRLTAWILIVLLFASGGLALFDMYLLLSGLQ